MLGVVGAGIAAVVFGLLFVIALSSFLQTSSTGDLLAALAGLGLTGIAVALFDLLNNRPR